MAAPCWIRRVCVNYSSPMQKKVWRKSFPTSMNSRSNRTTARLEPFDVGPQAVHVHAALERGEIDEARLARWRKLVAEDQHNTASLAQRRSKDKAFGKMVKQAKKHKSK